MSGASRWLDAPAELGPSPRVATTAPSAARAAATNRPRTSVLTRATPLSATALHRGVRTVGWRITFAAQPEPVHRSGRPVLAAAPIAGGAVLCGLEAAEHRRLVGRAV